MGKTWTTLDSSDAIRERLNRLETAGLSEDIHGEADIVYADGYDDIFDGIIVEASVERFGLYFENRGWEDERDDAYWADDANRVAERIMRG